MKHRLIALAFFLAFATAAFAQSDSKQVLRWRSS